jgi:hypothetical protein
VKARTGLGIHAGNAGGGIDNALTIWVFANSDEDLSNGFLDAFQIYRGGHNWRQWGGIRNVQIILWGNNACNPWTIYWTACWAAATGRGRINLAHVLGPFAKET